MKNEITIALHIDGIGFRNHHMTKRLGENIYTSCDWNFAYNKIPAPKLVATFVDEETVEIVSTGQKCKVLVQGGFKGESK